MGSLYSLADLEYMFYAALRNGSIGTIGATGPAGGIVTNGLVSTDDLNTFQSTGIWTCGNGTYATLALNYPQAGKAGTLLVLREHSSLQHQIYYVSDLYGRVTYQRTYQNSAWSSWRAYNSTRVDQTAGRAVYQWDDVNNREQIIYGDTGQRDIAASVLNGWTVGLANIRRIGYQVYLGLYNFNPAGQTASAAFNLPVGFRPATYNGTIGMLTQGGTLQVAANGDVIPNTSASSATGFIHIISFATGDAWPTTLPGSALGGQGIPNT